MGDQPLQCQRPVGHRFNRPVSGGGGGCCFSVPARWTPGMTVRVEWETGQGSSAGFPGFADEAKYLARKKGLMPKRGSTAKPFRCPTITAGCVRHYGALFTLR
nr:DUF3304 domain-containing protein [Klebsiella pneumoniae]